MSQRVGNSLFYIFVSALILSSGLKFLHPTRVVAYMGFLGYQNGTFFLVGLREVPAAVLFLLPSMRAGGLLLVSAYFGGANSAHLAQHAFVGGGSFLRFNAAHPFLGTIPASIFLMAASLGVWLRHPEARWSGGMKETAPISGSL